MLQQAYTPSNTGLQSFVDASADYELAPVGIGSIRNQVDRLAEFGRNGDIYVVHAAEGETVIPMEVLDANPQVREMLFAQMRDMGMDPGRYVVGNELNSINPDTGMPEFFISKIWKSVKKVFKAAAPILAVVVGNALLPGIGGIIASMAYTKLSGGSWGDTLKAGAMAYAGGVIMGGIGGIGSPGGFVGGLTEAAAAPWNAMSNLGSTWNSGILGAGTYAGPGSSWFGGSDPGTGIPASVPAASAGDAAGGFQAGVGADASGAISAGGGWDPGVEYSAGIQGGAPASSAATGTGAGAIRADLNVDPTLPRTPSAGEFLVARARANAAGIPPISPEAARVASLTGIPAKTTIGPPDTGALQGASASIDSYTPSDTLGGGLSGTGETYADTLGGGSGVDSVSESNWWDDTVEFADKWGTKAGDILAGETPTNEALFKRAGELQALAKAQPGTLALSHQDALAMAPKELSPGPIRTYAPTLALLGGASYAGGAFDEEEDPERAAREEAEERARQRLAELSAPIKTGSEYMIPEGSLDPYKYPVTPNPRAYVADGGLIGGQPQHLNYGGMAQYPRREMLVEGPGTGRSDDIPAMLSDGEFVLNARSVRGADPTGQGNRYRGAQNLYNMMRNFEMRG